VGLWGEVSWANLLGGLAVGALLAWLVPLTAVRPERSVRVGPMLVYVGRFLRDLVVAPATVAVQVFWDPARLRRAVGTVPAPAADPGVLALVSNTISLTPGTLTLEADPEHNRLVIHVLHLGTRAEVESMVARLCSQANLALTGSRSPAPPLDRGGHGGHKGQGS
jgi:multicomponent Na+:H+ antiporter subunit E